MTVAEILEHAKTLSQHEREELAQLLMAMNIPPIDKKRNLSELRGLGKEIWSGIDAQDYVNQLRDEWNEDRP